MAVPPSIPTVLGSLAVFTTSALVSVHVVLAHELAHQAASSTYTVAITSASLEGAALLVLSAHLVSHVWRRKRSNSLLGEQRWRQFFFSGHGAWLLSSILVCTAAAAVSIIALIRLAQLPRTLLSSTIFGPDAVPFLSGASVTLGICFVAQLLFLTALFAGSRSSSNNNSSIGQVDQADLAALENGYGKGDKTGRSVSNGSSGSSGSSSGSSGLSPTSTRAKAIPYSKTAQLPSNNTEKKTSTWPPREGGVPKAEASSLKAIGPIGSMRLSLSHVIRPITSKTRLLSPTGPASQAGSPPSPTAAHGMATRPSIEDFDSWDTSAVDPQSRQTVLASSVSPPPPPANRFLATMPSRSPSSGTALDLTPPRTRHRRHRSDSPTGSVRSTSTYGTRARSQSHSQAPVFPPPPAAMLRPPPPSEAHIHPLFRSDSPMPAPCVSSAGTVVTAAPNGGQVMVAGASSLRTRFRVHSGNSPAVSSPLGRKGWRGVATIGGNGKSKAREQEGTELPELGVRGRTAGEGVDNGTREDEVEFKDEVEDEDDDEDNRRRVRANSGAERKMTPPIPDWILSAGARRSLSGYQTRRVRV